MYVLFALELHLGRAQVLQRKGPIKVHQGKRTQIRQQLPVIVIRLARVPPPPVRVLPEHVLQRDRCSLGFADALPLVLGGRYIGLRGIVTRCGGMFEAPGVGFGVTMPTVERFNQHFLAATDDFEQGRPGQAGKLFHRLHLLEIDVQRTTAREEGKTMGLDKEPQPATSKERASSLTIYPHQRDLPRRNRRHCPAPAARTAPGKSGSRPRSCGRPRSFSAGMVNWEFCALL